MNEQLEQMPTKEIRMIKITILTVAMLFMTEQLICQNIDQAKTIGESIIFNSQVLKTPREIQIYLPESYDDTSIKYPVLYVLDGQRYFLNGITFQQNLVWKEIVPNFIIVGIVTDSQKRRTLLYDESKLFIQFLEKELIPKIDSDYRTLNERIYFGWEMAAGLGIEILADMPSLFSGYLLASPTFISDERLDNVKKMLDGNPKQNVTIYASLGVVENWAVESMNSLDSLMQQYQHKNIDWEYNLSENENHYTTPLITINEGLKSFFSDYNPIRFYTLKEFSDFGGINALREHYINRGNRYQIAGDIHDDTKRYLFIISYRENNFKVFDELVKEFDGKTFITNNFNNANWSYRYATFFLSNNKLADALEILELGLLKFPDASILNNGMGNYYKENGEVDKAKRWYQKAISIAETNDESGLSEYRKNLESLETSANKK